MWSLQVSSIVTRDIQKLLGSVLWVSERVHSFFWRLCRIRGRLLWHTCIVCERCVFVKCWSPWKCSPQINMFHSPPKWISVKQCSLLWYSVSNNRFCFYWPVPRFHTRFCHHRHLKALSTLFNFSVWRPPQDRLHILTKMHLNLKLPQSSSGC